MSRNRATPSLPIFLKVPCKHQERNGVWVHIPCLTLAVNAHHPTKYTQVLLGNPLKWKLTQGPPCLWLARKYTATFFSAGQAPQLVESGIVLRTYTGEEVKPKGSCSVNVCYDGVEYSVPLLVVGSKGPTLLSRNWLEEIKLDHSPFLGNQSR